MQIQPLFCTMKRVPVRNIVLASCIYRSYNCMSTSICQIHIIAYLCYSSVRMAYILLYTYLLQLSIYIYIYITICTLHIKYLVYVFIPLKLNVDANKHAMFEKSYLFQTHQLCYRNFWGVYITLRISAPLPID